MFMAMDQYGETYHDLKYPRKDLAEKLGFSPSSLNKMYVDSKEGVKHVGYIIGGLWLRLYNVTPFERKESNYA